MNTKKICKEFEKFFGPHEKRKFKRREILTTNKNFCHHHCLPSSMRRVFVSIYQFLRLNLIMEKNVDITFACAEMYIDVFVRGFVESVEKNVLENIKLVEFFIILLFPL